MVNWLPEMAMGNYTGQYQAGWTVTGNDDFIVFGGEFPRVNGTAQQGLVRFGKRPVAPGTQGPLFVGGTFVPADQRADHHVGPDHLAGRASTATTAR